MNSAMSPRIESVIFCDDIRREDNGKVILIGVYGSDLVPGAVPSSFAISLWFRIANLSTGNHDFRFRIVGPDGKAEFGIDGQTTIMPDAQPALFAFSGLPVQVAGYGDIIAYISFDSGDDIEIGRLPVRQSQAHDINHPSPTA